MIYVDPRKVVLTGFLALTSVLMAPVMHAQAVAVAEVDGTVSDTSGKVMVNVPVTMIQADTQAVHSTITDAQGHFAIPNLPPGPYVLNVKSPGFKDYRQTGIVLQVGQTTTINVAMTVGSVTETVEVAANASMVETKDSAIAQVMDQAKIVDLPLNGRNLTQLLTLVGGGTTTAGRRSDGQQEHPGVERFGHFLGGGGQANGVNYLLDGGDNNDSFSNVNLPIPFPDAVQEFSVQTNAMQAQFGLHPGGAVNVVTKSGTNAFHGDLFEFLRNYELNARTKGLVEVSGSVAQPSRDSLKRNQFGGTAGGKNHQGQALLLRRISTDGAAQQPGDEHGARPDGVDIGRKFLGGRCRHFGRRLPDEGHHAEGSHHGLIRSRAISFRQSRFDPAAVKLLSKYIPTSTDNCGTFSLRAAGRTIRTGRRSAAWIMSISEKHLIYGRYYIYNYTAQRVLQRNERADHGTESRQSR